MNGGRPATSNPGVNRRTDYAYGSLDRLFSVTAVLAADASGNPTTFQQTGYEYDPAASSSVNTYDFVTAIDYPDKTTGVASSAAPVTDKKRITYTLMGDEATIRDPNQSLEYRRLWDAAGRFTESRILSLGSGVDGAVRRKTVAYDGAGRPYKFTSHVGLGTGVANQVQRDFNGFGQLTAEYQEHGTSVNTGTSPKVQYAYSETDGGTTNNSRLNNITDPNGRVLNYKYAGASGLDDKISRVSSLEETVNSVTTTLEAYDYLGLGTIVQRRRPQPGSDLTYYGTGATGDAGDQYAGLDRFGRISDQWWKKGAIDTDRFKYGYDENANRIWKDVLGAGNPGTIDESYTYDNLNRLTKVNRGSLSSNTITDAASNWRQTWTLDALGNWSTFVTDTNGGVQGVSGETTQTRTFNARNQITSISGATTPVYDNNGNTTKDETNKRYVYDAWNRVVGFDANNDGDVLDAGDVVYKYDALDRRISEAPVGSTTTHLYYSPNWQVLEERQGSSSTPVAQNVWGLGYVDAMVLRDRDTTTGGDLGKTGSGLDERLYVQQDANYNVTSLVNTSGTVVERNQYTPYGTVQIKDASWANRGSSSYAWVYLHQGGRYDTYTANSHFRNRDFDVSLGVWNRPDPLGFVDGPHLYQYLSANPLTFIDPQGTDRYMSNGNIIKGEFHQGVAVDVWKKDPKTCQWVKVGVTTYDFSVTIPVTNHLTLTMAHAAA